VILVASTMATRYLDLRMDEGGQRPGDGAQLEPAGGLEAWAISGMGSLSGRPDGPALAPPAGLVDAAAVAAAELERRSALLGHRVSIDPLATLAERAVVNGFSRRGEISCGGTARLMPATDGWVAVNLARPDDWDLMDAWLEPRRPIASGDWAAVADEVAGRATGALIGRSILLGLPVAVVAERGRVTAGPDGTDGTDALDLGLPGVRAGSIRPDDPYPLETGTLRSLLVVDLSSLWAGPLCGSLLQRAGARVVKVESLSRPDGARGGPPEFFSSMNGAKSSVGLDFDTPDGRRRLRTLVSRADVVITAARPRALEQLGLVARDMVEEGGPRVWLSITGYGASGAGGDAERVAFGDDAAAAGGLVVWDERGPCFCGDAIADPLSGMVATVAVLAALERGGAWVLDLSMADVAAGCSRPVTVDAGGAGVASPLSPVPPVQPGCSGSRSASPPESAPRLGLGADTDAVLAELGIR
jgi:crotonobetainyl-CoA:carnitine CoA-transferase CaiB-like acyl-CoA transferase